MMDINLELCKIFYVVAETGNITKGAEKLFISQPAVSQSIKKLEEQIGGVLFSRSNKGLVLTEEGKMFLQYVKGALNLINNAKIEFSNFRELKSGIVKIGVSTTLAKSVLLKPLQEFHKQYPNIYFKITNELTKNLLNDLEKGNLDFVIINEGEENAGFDVYPLKKVSYNFLYNSEFFDYSKTYSLQDLSNMPLILQKPQANSRQLLDKFCLNNKIKLNPIMEVVSQELAVEFAKIGLGVAFSVKENNDNLKIIKLNTLFPQSEIQILTNKFFSLSFASKVLIDFVKKYN